MFITTLILIINITSYSRCFTHPWLLSFLSLDLCLSQNDKFMVNRNESFPLATKRQACQLLENTDIGPEQETTQRN